MTDPIELLTKNRNESRAKVLLDAASAVLQDRNVDYGMPEDNFKDITDMISIYLRGLNRELLPHDSAVFNIITKICRLKQSYRKLDHWTDIAGYSACGYRSTCATEEMKKEKKEEVKSILSDSTNSKFFNYARD